MSTPLKFDDFLALLVDRGVPLCEVRPRARSATEASNDLDLLVPIDAFKRLPEILYPACMHAGLSFVIRRFSRINLKLCVLQASRWLAPYPRFLERTSGARPTRPTAMLAEIFLVRLEGSHGMSGNVS